MCHAFSLRTFALLGAVALSAGALPACGGGRVIPSGPTDAGVDAQPSPPATTVVVDGATCIDIELTAADQACAADTDCALVDTGVMCEQGCGCPGGTPVNVTAAATIGAEIDGADLPRTQACPGGCAVVGQARCIAGACTLCPFEVTGDPIAGCGDADAGVTIEVDAGEAISPPATCDQVDPTAFDQACVEASDCVVIAAGDVCDGDCSCEGAAAINVDSQSAYEAAISNIQLQACHCVPSTPACVAGTCTVCPPGQPDCATK